MPTDYSADPEVAEEIGQMLVDGIKKAGTMLKMQVPLDGEFKVGNNAAEIHYANTLPLSLLPRILLYNQSQ